MSINQLKAGAILNYCIIGLNALVGIIYTPYMLRMMGQSEYGLYSIAAAIIAYLTLLDLGFGNAIIRYTAKFRAESKITEQYSMFGVFIVLYSIISVITLISGIVLCYKTDAIFDNSFTPLEIERAKTVILLLTFNLAITFPLSIYGAIITAYEKFVFLRCVQLIRIVLNTIVMIVLLSYGYKAIAMVVVQTVFNVLSLLFNVYFCKKKIGIRIVFERINTSFLKEVALYSFWIFLNAIMDRVYWSTGQFVLGATVGTKAVSVFAVAILLQGIYMSFSLAISGVFLPKLTTMVALESSNKQISDIFIKIGRFQYIVMAFLLSGFIVFGKIFINMWAGVEYDEAFYITLLFWIPLTIPLIQNLGIIILQARNQMKFRSILYIILAVVSLILQIYLSRLYGAIGCAIAIAGALIIGQIIVMNIYYYRKQKIDIITFWYEIIKMSLVPAIVAGVSYFILNKVEINSISKLVAGIFLFSIVYIPLFWFFSMNKYEKDIVFAIVKKVSRK